jgi:hypothetical protein
VDKEKFNYLVSNYNSLSQQETAELRLEQDHYGYCQVLHHLIARGDQDNQTEMREQSLHVAAVYSTDRSVLKKVMTEPRAERMEVSQAPVESAHQIEPAPQPEVKETIAPSVVIEVVKNPEPEIVVEKANEPVKSEAIIPKSDPDFDPEQALSRFLSDLEPMRKNRLLFEKAVEDFENRPHHAAPEEEPIPEEKPKRRGRPKSNPSTEVEPTVSTSEKLLDEIKTTKKKVIPDSPKQKEQTEIIDQFIKSKPSISKPTGTQVQLDLTEPNESYNENVVSETLAMILIKQGKKEKAVEVLRKLIWKFPQKKAYFAAQIEDLTK